jgi:hypothetical protein
MSASEAIHATSQRKNGSLREACHPAALCADRLARKDVDGSCPDNAGRDRPATLIFGHDVANFLG